MRIAWATDIHLNAAELPVIEEFCAAVLKEQSEALFLGGDIAEAPDHVEWLEFLDARLELPTYFVLGNHDFYGADISSVRDVVRQLDHPRLRWLPAAGRIPLTRSVSLVGHDGWGDCRIGAVDNFEILADYLAITDLFDQIDRDDLLGGFSNREALRNKLRALGDQAAAELRAPLLEAAQKDAAVLVLTHVPPFREACWHGATISEETWLPGFTCKAVGDLLLEVAEGRPGTQITVLCGHSHGSGYAQLRSNLDVYTGRGGYGSLFFSVIEVGKSSIAVAETTA